MGFLLVVRGRFVNHSGRNYLHPSAALRRGQVTLRGTILCCSMYPGFPFLRRARLAFTPILVGETGRPSLLLRIDKPQNYS